MQHKKHQEGKREAQKAYEKRRKRKKEKEVHVRGLKKKAEPGSSKTAKKARDPPRRLSIVDKRLRQFKRKRQKKKKKETQGTEEKPRPS